MIRRLSVTTFPSAVRTQGVCPLGFTDEYQRGFVHAKTMVVDDWMGTVGSANMDIRSFHLNFEANALVYDALFAQGLAEVFISDLEDARQVDLENQQSIGYWRTLSRGFARLLSPLL